MPCCVIIVSWHFDKFFKSFFFFMCWSKNSLLSNIIQIVIFGCIVAADLYLFLDIVLLHTCFKFSKNLTVSFIDKVTTGT